MGILLGFIFGSIFTIILLACNYHLITDDEIKNELVCFSSLNACYKIEKIK